MVCVPRDGAGVFKLDLAAAGMPKRDGRGRTVDSHAVRHTFGTHLPSRAMARFGGRRPEQERRGTQTSVAAMAFHLVADLGLDTRVEHTPGPVLQSLVQGRAGVRLDLLQPSHDAMLV